MVVIPAEASSPDSEPVLEKDDLMDLDASQQVRTTRERNLALPIDPKCRREDGRGSDGATLTLPRASCLVTQALT